MTVYGCRLPGAASLADWARRTGTLSQEAQTKLKILDWHKAHGAHPSLTARHFGIGRMTLNRWLHRFRQYGLVGLNNRTRKPKHLRRPTTLWESVSTVVKLRQQYPTWSKYKLQVLIAREDIKLSTSTIGRILKRKGLINRKISQKRKHAALHPKARFPKGMHISQPGDMVQMDTKYISLVGGRKYYQFTAIDVLSKRRVLRVYSTQSSRNGALFLTECLEKFPFPVRNVQTDNGAPFQKEFARLCGELNLPHYYIYPKTPKQNSYVEISHGADEREFYQQGNVCSLLPVMQKRIQEWEDTWNNTRPHQALNYLTPNEYLLRLQTQRLPTRNVIVLQT